MIKQIYKRTAIVHCARKSVMAKKKKKNISQGNSIVRIDLRIIPHNGNPTLTFSFEDLGYTK